MARRGRTPVVSDYVDIENGIIHGVLKQVRAQDSDSFRSKTASLVEVWCCEIIPTQAQLLANVIRDHINSNDEVSLIHLKRFLKEERSDVTVLKAVLCSTTFLETEEAVMTFIAAHTNIDIKCLYTIEVPKYPARTKEISDLWSDTYWPMSWKGNPNHQFLNSVTFNMDFEKSIVNKLIEKYKQSLTYPCSVTIIAKETENNEGEILAITRSTDCTNPYNHSVMQAIDFISESEKQRRKLATGKHKEPSNYLCHNLWFYVTHEPCVMCCMALVHSRIGRIIYLKESPQSGGLESNYQLGDRDGLNWKFDIWKWIDQKDIDTLDSLGKNLQVEHNVNY
ncbi:tRNA-specific adenosine-34 deaminase subunit [Scheffersomyces amazonensis]|uniref:tRNA-specific adenosine-34 deaminase subunit n=1 Tax=Scheffersomyces amazonensis TaxID=1078765 RepID=UPI00315CA4F3